MQADRYKGVAELEILGEKIGFKFGVATMSLLCDLENDTFKNVVARLDDPTNVKTQINFYFAAAVCYIRLKNADDKTNLIEPTFDQVANWMDSVSAEVKEKLNETAFATYQDPNSQAPQETGQQS